MLFEFLIVSGQILVTLPQEHIARFHGFWRDKAHIDVALERFFECLFIDDFAFAIFG